MFHWKLFMQRFNFKIKLCYWDICFACLFFLMGSFSGKKIIWIWIKCCTHKIFCTLNAGWCANCASTVSDRLNLGVAKILHSYSPPDLWNISQNHRIFPNTLKYFWLKRKISLTDWIWVCQYIAIPPHPSSEMNIVTTYF